MIDTGVTIVTPENLNDARARATASNPRRPVSSSGPCAAPRGTPQALRRDRRARRRRPGAAPRRGARADRRERRRQEHADERPRGRAGARRGDDARWTAAYAPASPRAARHAGVALIHQELSLCPHLTVAENILLGREPSRGGWLDQRAMRARRPRLLESFPHPDSRPTAVVGELPMRRAAGRRDLPRDGRRRASIVLMDEPTSSLPREDVERLFALIRRLRAQRRGRRLHQPLPRGGARDRRSLHRAARRPQRGHRHARGVTNDAADRAHGRPPGRRAVPDRPPEPREDVLLDVRTWPRRRRAARRFELRRGEILGIAGLVGSGRTESVRALLGLEPAASGRVRAHGRRGCARPRAPRRVSAPASAI